MDQQPLHQRTLTELLDILLAVVLELLRRFGFPQPGLPILPDTETHCPDQCAFCDLQCRRHFRHRGRHWAGGEP